MPRAHAHVLALIILMSLLSWMGISEGSTSVLVSVDRYPLWGPWTSMPDGYAYFRDAFVGALISIANAQDGETWGGSVIRPDNTSEYWWPIQFHAQYDGKSNCFVCGNWIGPRCGSNNAKINWYTNVRPDAESGMPCYPTGVWKFNFWNNDVVFATPEFTLLPQIPGVPVFSQTSNTTPYANICKGPLKNGRITCVPCSAIYQVPWTIAAKGCALICAVMVLRYHGVDTGTDG